MWNIRSIEKQLQASLIKKFGKDDGNVYFTNYEQARNYLVSEVLPEIKAIEPSLTDHSAKHVADVLDRAERLLNDDIKELTPLELYCLCLIILFHDVGNINGRTDHQRKILDVYNKVRNNQAIFNPERLLVLKAVEAHCGKTKKLSRDTLKELETTPYSLNGYPIRLQELASIVRFADELAEGPQRTSDYRDFNDESKIYHEYSKITNIFIDRGNCRIVLTYHIDVKSNSDIEELTDLLLFTYKRIIKLDEERRYTKFYSPLLNPFKKTEITFSFLKDGELIDIEDLGRIELPDSCIIPGEQDPCPEKLVERFKALQIENIIKKLKLKKKRNGK